MYRYYSSSSESDSDVSFSSDDEYGDDGPPVVTVNGKRISPDEASVRLGNIQIGSGRCLVVGGKSSHKHKHRYKHHEHHEKRKKGKDRDDHSHKCHIDPAVLISRSHLDIVASEIGKHWKKLARELGLSRGVIEAVSIDFSVEGTYEQAYQALRKWTQKHGNNAKLYELVKGLEAVGFEEICEKLGKG